MIGPRDWGMPLIITEEDFSRQARFDRQWDAYKKAFIDSFIKKENKEMGNSNYTYGMPSADQVSFNKYCEQDIASISKMSQKKDPYLIIDYIDSAKQLKEMINRIFGVGGSDGN